MISSKFIAYLNSVRALRRLHLLGLPLVPKRLIKLAPFNRELYNSFVIEATVWSLHPKAVIFDVGANNGDFALAFQQVYPEARISLFEPLAKHVARLHQIKEAGGFSWDIHPVALGATNEEMEIEVPDGLEDASSLHGFGEDYLKHSPSAGKTTRLACQVRRLDELLGAEDGEIDLLKVDVEGFEFSMLEGAGITLRRVRNVVVEVSRLRHAKEPTCPIARMVRLMEDAGLSLFRMQTTIHNPEIDPHPLEFDLYFTRQGTNSADDA